MIKNKKGTELTISASGIDTFTDCKRKWWYGYVERIRGPKSPAAERGDKIHDLAERILKGEADPATLEGEDATWFRFLEPGLQYAPSPEEVASGTWGVEDWVKEPAGPLTFVGKVDFYTKPLGGHTLPPIVGDWKTTSNKQWRWSKTPAQLAAHIQPHVYAYALHKDDPPATVRFQHVNLQSVGKPDAMEVWAPSVPWQDILDTWDEVVRTSEQMASLATSNDDALDITPNTKACKKYGGCPHAEYCPASPANRVTPNIPQVELPTMPINEELAAKQAAIRAKLGLSKASAPAISPAPKPEPPPAPPAPEVDPVARAIENVTKVLASMGSVPANVLTGLTHPHTSEVVEALGLVKTGDAWSVKAPTVFGTPVKDVDTVPSDAKAVAGILVPKDFGGTVAEAIAQWGTPEQQAASAVLEEVDPTAGLPTVTEVLADPTPVYLNQQSHDLDTRKAARSILTVINTEGSIDKGDTLDLIRAETSWKRTSKARLQDVADCASEMAGRRVVVDNGAFSWAETTPAPTPAEVIERQVEEAKVEAPVEPAPAPVVEAPVSIEAQLVEVEPPAPAPVVEPEPAPVVEAPRSVVVYVNCRPIHGEVEDFAAWIAEAEDLVAREEGVAYYGLVPYAQGPKLVAAKLRNLIQRQGLAGLPEHLVVDSFHPVAPDAIAILSATPGVTIVKAFR
jgi:hypothetical protein